MRSKLVVLTFGLLVPTVAAQKTERKPFPDKYVLDYPVAERFSPPIRSTFSEVERTSGQVRGHRFQQKPNGGYGLPVADRVDGKNLLHVGADLGWYQINEPVFAVANGVVRLSFGPKLPSNQSKKQSVHLTNAEAAALPWGNLVVIEHRTAADKYYTTIYGHLATKRLVKTGDIVKAGQAIGRIGRKHARINGGYKPHLHFGVREGRIADTGVAVIHMTTNEKNVPLTIKALGAEWTELECPKGLPLPTRLNLGGNSYLIVERDGKAMLPSEVLWQIQRPDFPLVGYALTTDGFLDPIKFLRDHQAHTAPAPYRLR